MLATLLPTQLRFATVTSRRLVFIRLQSCFVVVDMSPLTYSPRASAAKIAPFLRLALRTSRNRVYLAVAPKARPCSVLLLSRIGPSGISPGDGGPEAVRTDSDGDQIDDRDILPTESMSLEPILFDRHRPTL